MLPGWFRLTTNFKWPQRRKKSIGVRSDDLGGHSTGSRPPVHLFVGIVSHIQCATRRGSVGRTCPPLSWNIQKFCNMDKYAPLVKVDDTQIRIYSLVISLPRTHRDPERRCARESTLDLSLTSNKTFFNRLMLSL